LRTVSLLLELTEGGREFVRKLDRASLVSFGRVYAGLDEHFRGDMNGYLDVLIESMVKTDFPRGKDGDEGRGKFDDTECSS